MKVAVQKRPGRQAYRVTGHVATQKVGISQRLRHVDKEQEPGRPSITTKTKKGWNMREFQSGRDRKGCVSSSLRRSHALLLLCSSALAFWAGAAAAQDQQPAREGADVEAQEIIVSARRKDETLTTVPASITAYSSDFLQKQNIQSFADYATKIPNLTFQYGQGGASNSLWAGSRETTIRGVVGTGTTAYYINDTPVPASVSPQVLNLERIEVLKGPQGTLFGASSMGGNLRFITKKPSLSETEGTIQVQGGGTKTAGFDYDVNAQTNFLLVPDQLALDVAVGYTRDSGYTARQFRDADGQLVTKDGQGRTGVLSGSATLRMRFSDALEATVGVLGQSTKLRGFPAAYTPLPAYRPLSYTSLRAADVAEYSKDKWALGSFVLNYSGDGFAVVSSTSYFDRKIAEVEDNTEGTNQFFDAFYDDYNIDLDGGAVPGLRKQKERRFTQEARINFDDGTILPGLSGIAGVYYQKGLFDFFIPGIPVPALEQAGANPPYLVENRLTTHRRDVALFGELYYELVPRLTVTVGLRKYWIKTNDDASVDTGVVLPGGSDARPAAKSNQTGLIPKAVVSYKIGNQGNIYASMAKGFRPGGSQQKLPFVCDGELAQIGYTPDDVRQFKSDTLWSYEIGAKNRFAGGRLNASVAAFQIEWSKIQQDVLLPLCGVSFIANAGKARIRGGELELSGRPIANVPLTVQLGLGYTNAKLTDPGLLPQEPNSRLGLVPRWTASISGHYETPITDSVSLFVASDYSYTGSVFVPDGSGGFYRRQPFNILNGNIGVKFGRSQILVYGKNLLDKRLNFGDKPAAGFEESEPGPVGLQRKPRAVVSRPRQLGVQYRLEF
jgi:outer membrane receptor protein involved in Fe transport